jgi:uncharacterized protein YndB with AHSA1/START domain
MTASVTEHGINTDMSRYPLGNVIAHAGDRYSLTFVRDYPHSIDRIWQAITDPERTRTWWAATRIDLREGGQFDVQWLNGENGQPQHWTTGVILYLDPPNLLEQTNSDHGVLRWELAPLAGDSTRLTFTNEFSGEGKWVPMSLGGWHAHLDHLHEALDGKEIGWADWYPDFIHAWQSLHDEYQKVVPAQRSTT